MTRVAYINQWFSPTHSDVARWIAHALRHEGLDLAVVAGVPNYPTGIVSEGYSAHRAVREVIDGFPTQICPLYPSHDSSALRRLATYGSFALSSSWVARRTLAMADVNLVYSSPGTAALPALAARLRSGTPYVLLIQDLWPDSVFATGFLTEGMAHSAAKGILESFSALAYRHASHIAVITPGMRDALINRSVPADKVSVVFNWADESTYRPVPPNGVLRGRIGAAPNQTVLLYAGNHGHAQNLGAWIEAMARLTVTEDVQLVLLGDGPEKEGLAAAALAARVAVHFLDPVPSTQMAALAADADAMVISLADHPLFSITLPGKTQATLALGKAVLASGSGDLRRVIEDSGAGWVAAPDDPDAIARIITEAHREGRESLQMRGWSGLQYYRNTMSSEIGGAALASVLRRAAGDRKAR